MRISDWSSDVCSSDLRLSPRRTAAARGRRRGWSILASGREWTCDVAAHPQPVRIERSRDAHRSYMPSLRLDFARHERNSKDRNRRWAVISVGHYLAVSAVLFTLGVLGIFINRKNVIVILMAIELILLAVNINLVAFSAALGDQIGRASCRERVCQYV